MNLLVFGLAYILILNLTGFLICGIDINQAKKGRRRISEGTLLFVGSCGGCLGLLIGMNVFRHKTKHIKFKILAPLECVLWIVITIHIVFAAMEKHEITSLSNSGIPVREHLFVAGVEDLWNRSPNIAKATEGAGKSDFVLLLSHNPDVTMKQSTTHVDLVLSGHTHGGYATLFGFLAPALAWSDSITEYGQRFMSGWAKSRDGVDVFVSNGAGYLTVLPRVFARPQVIFITLEHIEMSSE